MKIALCIEYPLALRGGVSVLVEELAAEFSRLGHETILVSPDSGNLIKHSHQFVRQHVFWDPTQACPRTARRLANVLCGAGVDLAHFHLGGVFGWGNRFPGHCPVPYLARRGVICVTSSHLVVNILNGFCGPQKPLWFKLLMLPVAWLGKTLQLRACRAEIAVSKHDFKKLRAWYAPLRGRFHQIYHSRIHADESAGPPMKAREKVILNVGHLAQRKGQALLAEAFANVATRHEGWILQLAGQDNENTAETIAALARKTGLTSRIHLLGERNDAMALMRRASIYVQPSYQEALGLALQEAMFLGAAAIGSRVGGIPELIQPGQTGLLFEPGNMAQLSAGLDELMTHAERREEFGRAAAAAIRTSGMTVEAMSRHHLELYERLLRKN